MKKTLLTIAIVLGMTMTTFANGGGLFQRNYNAENGKSGYVFYNTDNSFFTKDDIQTPLLPSHGGDQDQPAPLGSGIVALMGLGAAYLVAKKRREE